MLNSQITLKTLNTKGCTIVDMSISNYFISKENSHSTPDLTSSAPKRGRSPQEEFAVKKLRFAMNEELNEEERKRAYSEARVWAKLLFDDQLSKVTDEIADVKEQGQVMKDDVNTRINDLFAKTEGTEEKLQGLQLEYEGLRREVGTLKVTGIRPMAPVLNRGPLAGISARNVKFFGKERNY